MNPLHQIPRSPGVRRRSPADGRARWTVEGDRSQRLLEMEHAGASGGIDPTPVVQAEGRVLVVLDLEELDAPSEGVHGARREVDHVPRRDGMPLQDALRAVRREGPDQTGLVDALAQARKQEGSGQCREDEPGLRLRGASERSGMHLERKHRCGVQGLHEDGERLGGGPADVGEPCDLGTARDQFR